MPKNARLLTVLLQEHRQTKLKLPLLLTPELLWLVSNRGCRGKPGRRAHLLINSRQTYLVLWISGHLSTARLPEAACNVDKTQAQLPLLMVDSALPVPSLACALAGPANAFHARTSLDIRVQLYP